MNGVPQSGADRCATAKSRVRAYWSNGFTVDYSPDLCMVSNQAWVMMARVQYIFW